MELNINPNCSRTLSIEEDDSFSNISHISCGLRNSFNSAYNSDSECSGPKSVRDMIQLYNKQFKKEETSQIHNKIKYKHNTAKRPQHQTEHLLAATKSSYCGLNNYSSHTNCKQFVDPIEHKSSQANDETLTCCKNYTACMCCQNRNHINSITTKMLSSTSSSSSTWLLRQNNENIPIKPSSFNNNASKCCIRSCNCSSSSICNCNKINANNDATHGSHHILVVENCSSHSDEAKEAYNNATSNNISAPILNAYETTELNKDLSNTNNGFFNKNNSQLAVEQQKILQQQQQHHSKNRLLSIDSVEEANICQDDIPIETSYQSKTTIAKTSSGK